MKSLHLEQYLGGFLGPRLSRRIPGYYVSLAILMLLISVELHLLASELQI